METVHSPCMNTNVTMTPAEIWCCAGMGVPITAEFKLLFYALVTMFRVRMHHGCVIWKMWCWSTLIVRLVMQLTKEDFDWPEFSDKLRDAVKNVSLGRGFQLIR